MVKKALKKTAAFLKKEQGVETIEFVLLLPLILFISFGFISLATGMLAKMIVVDAAREGARAVALGLDTASNVSGTTISGSGFSTSGSRLTTTTDSTSDPNFITVGVSYKVTSIVPGLPRLIGGDAWNNYFTVSSRSKFKKER